MGHIKNYRTDDVAPRDRFAFWREAVCDSYVQLGCDAPRTVGFSGELNIERHADLAISKVGGAAHSVERRKRDISASSDAFFLLSLQTGKSSRITQFSNASVLSPGDMGIYDSTYPYVLELSQGFSQTVLQLPKESLLARLPAAQMMGGTRIDGQTPIGKLVRDNILALSQHMSAADPTVAALLQKTMIDLIATGLADAGGGSADLSSPEQHILMRARSYICAHIGDPDLDRGRVAKEIGLSVRRLNGIFAKQGLSITETIRQKRLDSVASDLRDPRFAGMTISEIAMKDGFCNLQHFSNLFRSAFGVTPRGWRNGEAVSQDDITPPCTSSGQSIPPGISRSPDEGRS